MSALELIKRPPSLVEISGWRWASFGPSVQKGSSKRLFVPSTEFVVLVHSNSSQQPTKEFNTLIFSACFEPGRPMGMGGCKLAVGTRVYTDMPTYSPTV